MNDTCSEIDKLKKKYKFVELISNGGGSFVWSARHRRTNQTVAIKTTVVDLNESLATEVFAFVCVSIWADFL